MAEIPGNIPDEISADQELKERIIEVTQGFRELARDDIQRRLFALYIDTEGATRLVNGAKTTQVTDTRGTLTSFEVPDVFRRLLLEDNEAGQLDIEIVPADKIALSLRNPVTQNSVLIGGGILPYALPLISNVTKAQGLTSVSREAAEYAKTARADEHVITSYNHAKKLIGVASRIIADSQNLA